MQNTKQKYMNQKILEALKEKFTGASDDVLVRLANKIGKKITTEEDISPAVEKITLQELIDSEADRRATEVQKTAIQNYEKKYKLKDGMKYEDSEEMNSKDVQEIKEDAPEWAKQIIEANSKLAERLNAFESNKISTERKQKLQDIVDKLPDQLKKPYSRVAVDTLNEEQFAGLLAEIEGEVDSLFSDFNQKGAVFGRPTNNLGGTPRQELSKEQLAALSQRPDTTKENSQPF